MSLTSQVGTAAGILAAAGAAVSLWLGSERFTGPYRRAYRWFAVAAVLWGAGVIAAQKLAVPVGAAAVPLSFGDLPSLLALPVMAAGFARLAAAGSREAGLIPLPAGVRAQGNAATRVADGYILASALFLIAWVTLFRIVFLRAGAGVPTFAGELVHPLADLILLGACLPLAAVAGRRGAIPYLAVGRDGGHDHRGPVAGEPRCDPADPLDVRVAVLLGEAEALGEMRAHDVAVEVFDDLAPPLQLGADDVGDGGLARAGKPREPEREAPAGDLGRLRVMTHEHRRALVLAHELADEVVHLVGALRVELTCRLVGEEDAGLVRERRAQRDALLLAAGELAWAAVALRREADALEQLVRACKPSRLG